MVDLLSCMEVFGGLLRYFVVLLLKTTNLFDQTTFETIGCSQHIATKKKCPRRWYAITWSITCFISLVDASSLPVRMIRFGIRKRLFNGKLMFMGKIHQKLWRLFGDEINQNRNLQGNQLNKKPKPNQPQKRLDLMGSTFFPSMTQNKPKSNM